MSLILVFGPTLLKTTEGSASLSSLVDTVHQTRVVELLTRFNPDDPSPNARYLPSTLFTTISFAQARNRGLWPCHHPRGRSPRRAGQPSKAEREALGK